MFRVQTLLFFVLLLVSSSDVGLSQTDISGTWKVRLQIDPMFGTGIHESTWEIEQQGKKVSGRIIEKGSGKVTEFTDGYRGRSGSLDFSIKSQFEGRTANIEVGVRVKDEKFEGLYDIVIPSEFSDDPEANADFLAMSGKLTGKKVADGISPKKGNKTASKTGSNKSSGSKDVENEVLFDGQNLHNFRGYKKEAIGKGWKVEDGQLHFDGKKSDGDIITKKKYGSFELTFEWKISAGGNSGVIYRVTQGAKEAFMTGIEYQILDNLKHREGRDRKTSAAAMHGLYPPGDATPNAPGEWNSSKIVADGDKVEHWLNGVKVVEAEIDSEQWNENVAASKFAKWKKFGKSKRGHIAFQNDRDPVWYRDIKIKVMD